MQSELSDKQHRLRARVGTWVGEERMAPSQWAPDGMTAEGCNETRMAAGGFAQVTEYTQKIDGKVTFQGLSVTAWDPSAEGYVLHWYDSMGSPPQVYRGDFEASGAGERLVFLGPGPGGAQQRLISEYPDADTLQASAESSTDGEVWTQTFEATYKRVD